jgi:hypothetical protein
LLYAAPHQSANRFGPLIHLTPKEIPMFEQMSSQVLSISKQFAETLVNANAVAVDHFQKVMDVQLKNVEDRMNVVAGFVETAATVKSPEEFRALMPKTVSMIKDNAEKSVAVGQEIGGIFTRTSEQLVNLAKGQFEVANEAVLKTSKAANKR